MTELIHRSCRMKRPFGVNPFQRASMESFSQMPVPFAALTVLEYDEKGLGRVHWLSYVYERREWWRSERERESHSAGDGEMK